MEDGAFALFFRPHPGGFDSSRVPTPENLPSKAKKMLMPGGQPGGQPLSFTDSRNFVKGVNLWQFHQIIVLKGW